MNAHAALLIVHVGGGAVALAAGTAALLLRKGGRAHARAGAWFFAGMMTLFATGFVLAVAGSFRGTAGSAVWGAYLVASARATARRRDGRTGGFELVGLAVAIGCALVEAGWGVQAMQMPGGRLDGFPAPPYFAIAGLAALTAALDLNYILRRTRSHAQRIARHLWRMTSALLFASFSFLIGQQKVMPAVMHGSPILTALAFAPLFFLLFWLARVRFGRAFRPVAAPA